MKEKTTEGERVVAEVSKMKGNTDKFSSFLYLSACPSKFHFFCSVCGLLSEHLHDGGPISFTIPILRLSIKLIYNAKEGAHFSENALLYCCWLQATYSRRMK